MVTKKIIMIVAPLVLVLVSVFVMASYYDRRTTADIYGEATVASSEPAETSSAAADPKDPSKNTATPTPTKPLPTLTPKPGRKLNTPTPTPKPSQETEADDDDGEG